MIKFEGFDLNDFVQNVDKHILSYVDFYFDEMCREIDLVDKDSVKKEIIYHYFKLLSSNIGSVYFDKSSFVVDNIVKNIQDNTDYDGLGLSDGDLRYLLNSRLGVLLCIRGHTF